MSNENKNIIPVVFASDNNYVPYLAITIKLLIEHISSENFYEEIICRNLKEWLNITYEEKIT